MTDNKNDDSFNVNNVGLEVGRSVKAKLIKRLNGGSFGDIWLAQIIDGGTIGKNVAVKLERQSSAIPQLLKECEMYSFLSGGPGIPEMFWHGLYEPIYNVLIMELLGPSLQDASVFCDRKFSLKTILIILDQCLETLGYLHEKHVVHRDIKPDNWVLGVGDMQHKIYLIDFGLSIKKRRQSIMGSSRQMRTSFVAHPLVGTVRYASIGAHLGHEETCRDDLESLCYMIVYLFKGSLPWQGILAESREIRLAKILECKQSITAEKLAEGLPKQIIEFIDQCRNACGNFAISYTSARKYFEKVAISENIVYDNNFDWVIKELNTNTQLTCHTREELHHSS